MLEANKNETDALANWREWWDVWDESYWCLIDELEQKLDETMGLAAGKPYDQCDPHLLRAIEAAAGCAYEDITTRERFKAAIEAALQWQTTKSA